MWMPIKMTGKAHREKSRITHESEKQYREHVTWTMFRMIDCDGDEILDQRCAARHLLRHVRVRSSIIAFIWPLLFSKAWDNTIHLFSLTYTSMEKRAGIVAYDTDGAVSLDEQRIPGWWVLGGGVWSTLLTIIFHMRHLEPMG